MDKKIVITLNGYSEDNSNEIMKFKAEEVKQYMKKYEFWSDALDTVEYEAEPETTRHMVKV